MKTFRIALVLVAAVLAFACGGGGGGTGAQGATLVGRALSIETGSATNPKSQVKVGSAVVTTEDDGSFSIDVPAGTTAIVVDSLSAWGTFTYTFEAVDPGEDRDLGDLWVGPGKVSVRGRVISSATDQPIEAARVTFAGRSAQTGPDGRFTLTNVAYSGSTSAVFWGITGKISALDFFATEFTTEPKVAINAIVTLDDIRMTPADDIDPPPAPFNLWGRVFPDNEAAGTVATLKENGTPIREYTVGPDGRYMFWVGPGTYTVDFVKGNLDGTITATIAEANQVVRRDVTIQ